jgi:chorismate mutase
MTPILKKIIITFSFILCNLAKAVELTDITALINHRLSYMQGVAYYKYHQGIPVEDIERENLILANINSISQQYNLNTDTLVDFFQEQMDIAKNIQYRYIDKWRTQGLEIKQNKDTDLYNNIRPTIQDLSVKIIIAIYNYINEGKVFSVNEHEIFMQQINIDQLSQKNKHLLFQALSKINFNLPQYKARVELF